MGFKPSQGERDIWMRARDDHYEYAVVYVDDLDLASKDPESIVRELEETYGFSLKGTGPTLFHLGIDYFRDCHGVLCMAPKKYIDKMIETYDCSDANHVWYPLHSTMVIIQKSMIQKSLDLMTRRSFNL